VLESRAGLVYNMEHLSKSTTCFTEVVFTWSAETTTLLKHSNLSAPLAVSWHSKWYYHVLNGIILFIDHFCTPRCNAALGQYSLCIVLIYWFRCPCRLLSPLCLRWGWSSHSPSLSPLSSQRSSSRRCRAPASWQAQGREASCQNLTPTRAPIWSGARRAQDPSLRTCRRSPTTPTLLRCRATTPGWTASGPRTMTKSRPSPRRARLRKPRGWDRSSGIVQVKSMHKRLPRICNYQGSGMCLAIRAV